MFCLVPCKLGQTKSTHNAINGCLGIVTEEKTYTATILAGEVPRTSDPAVSEWGNLQLVWKPAVNKSARTNSCSAGNGSN